MCLNRLTGMISGILLAALSSFAVNYYVAPAPIGSDNAAGTLAAPFATITKARDVVKALGTLSEDANVYLRGGWYVITSPISLDATNSGSGNKNIVYQAMPGEYPVISGGVRITNWTISDASKNIWKAKANGINTRQLYVNCKRAIRAIGGAGNIGGSGLTKTSTGYTVSGSALASWRNQSDIEFIYTGTQGSGGMQWTESRVKVQSVSSTAITMQDPGFTRVCQGSQAHTNPTYIENAYELLNEPGEWYLDRTKDSVYYIPATGDNMATATVIAPVIEKIIDATGSLGTPIHNIQFKSITFAHATYMDPSTGNGLHNWQANYSGKSGPRMPGNVSFQYAQQIKFERCVFKHLGAVGLDMYNGAQRDTAIGCVFTDISGTCIQIGNVNDAQRTDTRLRDTSDAVINCYIHDSPAEYHGGIGIFCGYVSRLFVSHNQFSYLPYSAVSTGWGWSQSTNCSGNNEISYNNFDHWLQLLADGGAIYNLSPSAGTTWHHNYGHDMGQGGGTASLRCWYTDEGSANIDIGNNVSQNIGINSNWYSAWTSSIKNISVHDNFRDPSATDNGGTNVTITNTTVVTDGNWPQAAKDIMAGSGIQSAYADVKTMPCGCSMYAWSASDKPVITNVWATGTTQVKILFSKGVDAASATVAANYQIGTGVTVSSAVLSADSRTVTLVVNGLSDGTLYTLTVNNIKDKEVAQNTINANSTKQFGTLRYGLKVWLKFDETSGATAADASGNSNNSTVAGTASWGSGKVGGALAFNGVDTKVTVPAAVLGSATSGDYTAAMWINYAKPDNWAELFNTPTNSLIIKIWGQNFTGYLGSGGSIPNGSYTGSPATGHSTWITPQDAWTHLTFVKNGSVGKVYANGELAVIGTAGALTSQTWSIGGNPASGNVLFEGAIDDVRFYNRALTDGEIGQLALGNVDSASTPVVNKTPLRRTVVLPSSIEIYTVNGKLVKSLAPKDYSNSASIVRINNLPRGVYVMKSMYGTQQVVRKMVSVHNVGVLHVGMGE